MAILPNYISLLFPGAHFLSIIRIIRFFRIFRILKLAHFLREATVLADSLKKSIKRIAVFTLFIFIAVICIGSIMYVIEGGKNGFTSIPVSVYWAVVTMTTVGYGDISPQTPLGQFFSFWVMLLGYGVIAIPTGIVTSEIISSNKKIPPRSAWSAARKVMTTMPFIANTVAGHSTTNFGFCCFN